MELRGQGGAAAFRCAAEAGVGAGQGRQQPVGDQGRAGAAGTQVRRTPPCFGRLVGPGTGTGTGSGTGSGPGAAEAGQRPGFLDENGTTGRQFRRLVHAAAVGEAQGPPAHCEGKTADGAGAAGGRGPAEAFRQGHPGGRVEAGAAPVGHRATVLILDAGDLPAVRVGGGAQYETAVAHVQGPVAPAQIAEDVRPRLAVEQTAESGENRRELLLVERVDGDELAAAAAVAVLAVAVREDAPVADELVGIRRTSQKARTIARTGSARSGTVDTWIFHPCDGSPPSTPPPMRTPERPRLECGLPRADAGRHRHLRNFRPSTESFERLPPKITARTAERSPRKEEDLARRLGLRRH